MNFAEKEFSDFSRIEGKDIFQTAAEFYKFSEWSKSRKEYLCRRISLGASGPVMEIVDQGSSSPREVISFSSNGYLNLATHPKTIAAGIDAVRKYGSGTESVPLLGGTFDLHSHLEKKLADLKSCEDAIIYSSGYGSNVGTLKALLKKEDLAIIDQFAHASIADGTLNTTCRTFIHNDMNSLENVLRLNRSGKYETRIICIDGVYSMDGDIARLPEICDLAKKYGAYVFIDEAHATGVIGKNGKGTPEHFGLEGKIDIVAGTLSKAVGTVGGFVASNKEMVEYLRFYSRAFMFSTSGTPQATASAIAAVDVIINEPELRQKLWHNINYFKDRLLKLGFNIGHTETAIFPIIIGDNFKVKEMVKYLDNNNLYVNMILYPAIPIELSRLRITLTQGHTEEHLDKLLYHLELKGKELGII
jgi:glycine C-acetyltransferase